MHMKRTLLFLIAGFLSGLLCYYGCDNIQHDTGPRDTLHTIVVDTITVHAPTPTATDTLRHVSIRIPAAAPLEKPDTSACVSDSLEVRLPVVQRVYEDTTFRAYISGIEPQLDSLTLFRKTEYFSPAPDRTPATSAGRKRWHLGLSCGVGLSAGGPAPYIGIGVTYSLFDF